MRELASEAKEGVRWFGKEGFESLMAKELLWIH